MRQPSVQFLRASQRLHKDLTEAHRALKHAAAMADRACEELGEDDPQISGAGEVVASMARELGDLMDRLYQEGTE